jgi:hypothetical protein
MPKTLGRPKSSRRCHPRRIAIRMRLPRGVPGDPEKLADWRNTVVVAIGRVTEDLRALAADSREVDLALILPRMDEGDSTGARIAGLLASGANPDLVLAALRDLRRQVAAVSPDGTGAVSFTASSKRGPDGAPSSADLAAALGLVCVDTVERSWMSLPVGPSAFLASAPTAKS